MTTVEPIRKMEDIQKVERILSRQGRRNSLLFLIGINCGLRISDILALNVGDVQNRSFVEIYEKKTGKYKKFPINSKLKPLLNNYTKDKNPNDPLFLTIRNNRLDRVTSYNIIKEACKKAGIQETVGTHTMRKTFGYHHYMQFNNVVMLQKIFNHSSVETTLRYIGLEQEKIYMSLKNFIL